LPFKYLKFIIVKKILFITGVLFLLSASCRGPLAKPEAAGEQGMGMSQAPAATGAAHMEVAKPGKEDLTIEKAEGGITIAELFENKKEYSGKTVKVKGKVTKVNPEIMGKNWIHLQDGTIFEGEFDLTVTSDVLPETGSIVTIEGTVALDKDFGYGYTYPIMLEEAKIIQ
jgi:predicted RNA-binding protein